MARSALLEIQQISRSVKEPGKPLQLLLQGVSLSMAAGERLALFSTTNREAQSLLRCAAGVDSPDSGRVLQHGSVSWPVGQDEAFSNKLSGYENVRFPLAIYGRPGWMTQELALIEEFSGIDRQRLQDPLSSFNGDLKTRLAMAIPLALEFDLYPIVKLPGMDVVTPSSRGRLLLDRLTNELADAALLVAANDLWDFSQAVCHEGLVLIGGCIVYRGDLEVCREMISEERLRLREQQRQAMLAAADAVMSGSDRDFSASENDLESAV
ncbi:MAG: hypothetical protein ACK5E6_08525 [Cyanobacteriota bacterium]